MKKDIKDFFKKGTVTPVALGAVAIIAFLSIFGFVAAPPGTQPEAAMRLEPTEKMVTEGDTFEVLVIVESRIPVNVFAGELTFDHDVLYVDSIEYNTSIADIWAERPWYSNGAGTLNFIGGTTQEGGFQGDGILLRITFEAMNTGSGELVLESPHILKHDGIGSAATLEAPIDAIFTVNDPSVSEQNLTGAQDVRSRYSIVQELPSTDLNGDGKQSLADVSIFMLNVVGAYDPRYDFNGDGKVNMQDLSILLDAD